MTPLFSLYRPFVFVFFCFLVVNASAQTGGQERSFALGLSARTIGLGGAVNALADDAPAALSGNPAALNTLSRGQATLFDTSLFEGVRYDALSFAVPTLDRGAFGFSAAMVTTDGIDARDANNFTLGTLEYSEQQIGIAYALGIGAGLSAGIEGLWTRLKMGDVQDSSYGANFGLMGVRNLSPDVVLTVGASFKDWINTGLSLGEEIEKDTPSINIGVGLTRRMPNWTMLLLLEPSWLKDNGLRFRGGAELRFKRLASIRAGWNGDQPSFGASISYQSVSFDYALSLQDTFGMTHRVSLGMRFGPDVQVAAHNRKSKEERLKADILDKLKRESIGNYLKSGDKAFDEKRFEDAQTEYAKVLAWDPNNADAQSRMKRAEATAIEDSIRTKLSEANRLQKQGNDLDAMVLFKAVLELDPKSSTATQGLATSGKRLRDMSRKAFSTASNLPPAEAQLYFEKGLEHYLSGRYSQALEQWKALVANNPLQRQVFDYVSRAQGRLETDKNEAVQKQKVAVKEDRLKLLRQKAFENYRKGDLKSAIATWKDVLATDPQNVEAKTELEKAQKELQDSMKRGVRW
jgi:tetratricopeptide (TPR) repeat protein